MSENTENIEELNVLEAQDGSATVDLPEGMVDFGDEEGNKEPPQQKADGGDTESGDEDHEDDDEELRQAKRNRRRAKKDLIRKTNQEKDARLAQLSKDNEALSRRLAQLERNTQAQELTRIDKGIEDAQVRLEYAKMKYAEAASSNDGHALREAQELWDNAKDEVRNLSTLRHQADREIKERNNQQQVNVPDPRVQRNASDWMKRNDWYDPNIRDTDSRVAKKIDELMVAQGWDPTDPDYWDELDARLQKELPHRYNESNDDDSRQVRRPRNVVGSAGREASAAYGGSNRTQFVLSPERVKAMKDAGAWDNPERKARMVKNFIAFDRLNGKTY